MAKQILSITSFDHSPLMFSLSISRVHLWPEFPVSCKATAVQTALGASVASLFRHFVLTLMNNAAKSANVSTR